MDNIHFFTEVTFREGSLENKIFEVNPILQQLQSFLWWGKGSLNRADFGEEGKDDRQTYAAYLTPTVVSLLAVSSPKS